MAPAGGTAATTCRLCRVSRDIRPGRRVCKKCERRVRNEAAPPPAERLTREQQGNVEVVACVSRSITTIEQLLEAAGLPTGTLERTGDTEFVVDSWQSNKWDQGVLIDGVHTVVELWQVKAIIRRRKAVPIAFEPIRPLDITLKLPSKTANPSGRLRRCLIVPDSQNGFARDLHGNLDPLHDRDAWATMIAVARYAKPNGVIFLGDMLDLPDWSDKFVHGPEFDQTTQPAMVELAWNLSQVMGTLVPYGEEPPWGELLGGNHECFSGDTEVLTERGWVPFPEARNDDRLLTLNTERDVLEFQAPLAVRSYDFDGELNHVSSSRIDLMVTDNHRIWWRSGAPAAPYQMNPFSELPTTPGGRIYLRLAGSTDSAGVHFSDAEIRAAAWILTDGHIVSKPALQRPRPRPWRQYGFTQRPGRVALITSILDALGVEYTVRTRQRDIREVCGRALKTACQPTCDVYVKANSRHALERLVTKKGVLPHWTWAMDDRQARIFIETLVLADGSKHRSSPETSWVLYKDKGFLDQVQALCVMHGFSATLTEYRRGHWRLNLGPRVETCLDRFTSHTRRVPYRGKVWCAQVPNGTLVVRRNGKPVICGNSRIVKTFYSRLRGACELRPVDDLDGPPIYSLDRLLGLQKLGIRFHPDYPNGHVWLNDNLRISHGEKARGESLDTMKAIIRDARCSEIVGHIHRIELASKTTHPRHGAVTYVAFCPGTLARIDGAVPAATSRVNWQQGFAFVDYEPGNGRFWIQSVPIHGGTAIYDGKIFEGRFSMEELRRCIPGWKWAA